ncbi:MAG: hypothetical protein OZ948_17610 [Deltaproteobacteria bacterium]|nr:hypothetical protein [Deltaproteobacteria bacterium]
MSSRRSLLAAILLLAAPAASEEIGGHDEGWWRDEHEARVAGLTLSEARARECEETEAPRVYDGIGGYTVRGRDGRVRWVAIKRCDEQRAAREAARGDLERFEERARRAGVPPGWLR